MAGETLQKVRVRTRTDLRQWFETHHTQAESVWIVCFRKGQPFYLALTVVVEEALCFGWIDSLPRKLDDARTMLLVSPRKRGSNWSAVNKRLVARLATDGLMTSAGQAVVDQAKADGSWDALNAVDALHVPADLAAALDKTPSARTFFDAFPPSSRRGILEWIQNARQARTRARRIAETVSKAARNIKANHPRGRDAGPAPKSRG